MLSFIVPAHNEELWIGKCLANIHAAMQTVGEPFEVIVVDDASTDATHRIAEQTGARTLRVEHRKISAVRNSGARLARGEMFFFVDADTQINERAIRAALTVMRAGAAGGGCLFDFDGPTPLWARIVLSFASRLARLIRWTGGCFVFCTREAYGATGGFSESLYAGEDIAFVQALKKVGRFVVLKPKVVSSGRKLNVVSPREVLGLMVKIAIRGSRYESKWILDILYGRRAQDSRKPTKAAGRADLEIGAPVAMTESAPESPGKRPVSALPYAAFVPVLVVMAQSAWVVRGWNFRHNALLADVLNPVLLGGMAVIALISFFVIRPFVNQAPSRWVAFLGCALGFTILVESLMPKLAI